MANASSQVDWVEGLPVTVPTQPLPVQTSYILSPCRGWFNYLAQELTAAGAPNASCLVVWAGGCARWLGMERMVVIGNGPVSTNLYSPSDFGALLSAASRAIQGYRHHFLAIRNLTREHHESLIQGLESLGFVALPARVIYEFSAVTWLKQKPPINLTRDLKHLSKSGVLVQTLPRLAPDQAQQMCELYHRIYLRKHSLLNAQYTPAFFLDMVNNGWMKLLSVSDREERLLGFALLYEQSGVLSVPAVGYSEFSESLGGYRLIFASIYRHAEHHGLLLNYSSGAGDFKRKRGGQPLLEYTLLRAPAASRTRRRLLRWLANRLSRIRVEDLIRRGA